MGRARGNQRDLFDEAARVAELRPDLRTKLTPLLQALLSEAAGLDPSQVDDLGGEEVGDDQNHA
jgi:hypothetical protein